MEHVDETKHIILLGRSFKVTECDTDSEFLDKVLAMQEIPTEERMKRSVEDVEDVATSPPKHMNESTSGTSTRDVTLNADAGGRCEGVSEVEDADTEPRVEEDSTPSDIRVDHSSVASKLVSMQEHENKDGGSTEVPPEKGEEIDVEPGYSSQETMPLDAGPAGEDVHDGLAEVEDLPEDEGVNPSASMPVSVSNKVGLTEYSQSEWKGTTHSAEHMRLGYSQVVQSTGCESMRRIRGDNYCALRATLFQVLSQNLNILLSWKKIRDIISVPDELVQDYKCGWLTEWSFAGRLRVSPKKKIDTLRQCLQSFCDQVEASRSMETQDARILCFLSFFNSGREEEILLFEAIKLLMLHAAIALHADMTAGKEVPVFVWLLFARDTSETPEQLMKNHLNMVGDSGGLEQVEMFLLGYALNITIRVVRPSKVHEEDFMTFYPDDHRDEWDVCNLIAEDDRHYNVIIK